MSTAAWGIDWLELACTTVVGRRSHGMHNDDLTAKVLLVCCICSIQSLRGVASHAIEKMWPLSTRSELKRPLEAFRCGKHALRAMYVTRAINHIAVGEGRRRNCCSTRLHICQGFCIELNLLYARDRPLNKINMLAVPHGVQEW